MRQTYVLRDGKLVPKSTAAPLNSGVFHVMADIAPFQTQDGTAIGSRSALREYEQKHGVKQVGNDFSPQMRELRARTFGDA
jgi:hypothetical protein